MLKRLSDLLWLRKQIMGSNKSILLSLVMPFLLPLLYRVMFSSMRQEMAVFFTMLCLNIALHASVGMTIAAILTDEKEKGNLRTLLLSGVRVSDYLLSTMVYPLILSLVLMAAIPLILGLSFGANLLSYVVIGLLTTLAIILIYFLLGLFSKNQVTLQMYSMPVFMVALMLPNFYPSYAWARLVCDLTPFGLFIKLFYDWQKFSWSASLFQLATLLVWLVVLAYLTYRKAKTLRSLA